MINAARKDLVLISPYFIPSDKNIEHRVARARRTVLVRLRRNRLSVGPGPDLPRYLGRGRLSVIIQSALGIDTHISVQERF